MTAVNGGTPQLAITGRYSCPACPERFTDLKDKKAHIRTEHPKPKGGRR